MSFVVRMIAFVGLSPPFIPTHQEIPWLTFLIPFD